MRKNLCTCSTRWCNVLGQRQVKFDYLPRQHSGQVVQMPTSPYRLSRLRRSLLWRRDEKLATHSAAPANWHSNMARRPWLWLWLPPIFPQWWCFSKPDVVRKLGVLRSRDSVRHLLLGMASWGCIDTCKCTYDVYRCAHMYVCFHVYVCLHSCIRMYKRMILHSCECMYGWGVVVAHWQWAERGAQQKAHARRAIVAVIEPPWRKPFILGPRPYELKLKSQTLRPKSEIFCAWTLAPDSTWDSTV